MDHRRLEVEIYQIADDAVFKHNRADGTGWEWGWADWQRDWMNATPSRFAYRCLPLTIVNQTGWWIRNPVGFTATWRGGHYPGTIDFRFDVAAQVWGDWINSQFGEGIITWNTPFLFRTKPEGSRLLVCGPANYFKANAHPLTALIESDWVSMSFTMNWKIMVPNQPVRFDRGEPLFQAIPLLSNVCADLETAEVSYQKLTDNPDLYHAYHEWDKGRRRFHDLKAAGEVKANDWQKDYFQGRDAVGREAGSYHMTKVKPPIVRGAPSSGANDSTSSHSGGPGGATDGSPKRPEREGVPSVSSGKLVPTLDWRAEPLEQYLKRVYSEANVAVVTIGQSDNSGGEEEPEESSAPATEPPQNRQGQVDLLLERLNKRDWLLAVYRKSNRLHPQSAEIERRPRLSRGEFLREYYSTNRPVIITGMMEDWPAMRKWNLEYFAKNFGDRSVEVQMGRTAGANYETEREKYVRRVRFGDFLAKLRTAGETNDFYLTANNNSANRSILPELWDDIVQIPEYLAADPPGGFLWMGPAGTITPFHHDLTNNLMAQVIGRKRIKLAPSWDLPAMRNHLHCFSQVDGRAVPPAPHPALDEPQILEFLLHPGEILFLPVGCFHYVQGVDISVTVSFTNFVFDNDFSSFYSTFGPV